MKIEVGRKYKTKVGLEVEIVGKLARANEAYPYIGFHRDADGLVKWMDSYNESGAAIGTTSEEDLVPPVERIHRYYGFFRKNVSGLPTVVFAACGSKEAWERLKPKYTAKYTLLKEGYDFVDIEI